MHPSIHAQAFPMKCTCIFATLLLVFSADPPLADETAEPVSVFVSILPQEFLVERIGGDRVTVQALVQPGHSPHTYDPSPRQMAALARAQVYFRIGVGFERGFLHKIEGVHPDLLVVDTRKGIPLRRMTEHHHHETGEGEGGEHEPAAAHAEAHHGEGHANAKEASAADHGHEGCSHGHGKDGCKDGETHHDDGHGHGHGEGESHACPGCASGEHGTDPHIWLSPRLMKTQARTVAETLGKLDPAGAETYAENLATLKRDLDALDAKLATALAPVKGNPFFVFHPAWGYFADDYGLVQTAIQVEGKAPTARQLARLIEQAREKEVRVIFVQPQMSTASAQAVAEAISGAVLPINPLARDYIANLEAVADAIAASLASAKE